MMIVPTYVGPSEIEGVGVFAAGKIAVGTPIWSFDDRFDQLLSLKDVAGLPPVLQQFVQRYGYPHMTRPGLIVVEFDHGRFMNHTETPNTNFTDPDTGWALRDIEEGEEITCNYAEFDPSFTMQPGRRFVLNGGNGARTTFP